MDNNDVTLGEVYRAVTALDSRVRDGFEAAERAQHTLRNRQQATDTKVAVLAQRVGTVEIDVTDLEHAPDWPARFGAIGSAIGAAGAAFLALFHR